MHVVVGLVGGAEHPLGQHPQAGAVLLEALGHPDVEEFIGCKRENDRINNFNISVAITDEFTEAAGTDVPFELKNPRDGRVAKTVGAKDLFRKIVEGAWLKGESGVVFMDKINADNPTPQFPIESTNPCSEAHLPAYDSCNLGSINLARYVLDKRQDSYLRWLAPDLVAPFLLGAALYPIVWLPVSAVGVPLVGAIRAALTVVFGILGIRGASRYGSPGDAGSAPSGFVF